MSHQLDEMGSCIKPLDLKVLHIEAHSTKNQELMKLCLGNLNLMVNMCGDREYQMDVN